MTRPMFKTLSDKVRLTSLATDIIAARLHEDIHKSGEASLMVSGGSTPGALYQNLSNIRLAWDQVQIGLVDERWVDEIDPGSNAALVRKTLLQNYAENAKFLPMKTVHTHARDGQEDVEKTYQSIGRPYSAAVLGMGPDGHTASWFPQASGLDDALSATNKNLVQAITAKPSAVTGSYLERITLTRGALGTSTLALLLITGAEKRNVFKAAANDPQSRLPIRAAIDALGDRLIVLWAP